ncbi:MAG: biotin/lipoyl-binding protein, partial [Geobacter sp.]|nr:biotin/lipoyl-binding protein [Geobacter sp.]
MELKTRKRFIALLVIMAILACGTLIAKRLFWKKEQTAYITAPVARTDIEAKVLATGTLNAFKTVAVGAQVSGQVKTLHAALGERVKKGQLLAEIDPVLQQNSLRDAEASLENVQAQKRSKQVLLRQYQLALTRQEKMATLDASARADLESAQAQLESTRADLAALDAQIKKAKVSVDTARANLGYTRIVAPMDGIVIAIVTEEGQTVNANQTAPT